LQGMLYFSCCIPGSTGLNFHAAHMRNVLTMAKLLAVPHQYCELVLMHELHVTYIFKPRQFEGNLDNMMGLNVTRYLALMWWGGTRPLRACRCGSTWCKILSPLVVWCE
jgi:hypothetical protein